MKGILYWILTSRVFKAILNPRHGAVDNTENGKVYVSVCADDRLGDLVMKNHAIRQLQSIFKLTYCLTAAFFEKNKEFFTNHCMADGFLILPERRWQRLSFLLRIRRERVKAVLLDRNPLLGGSFFYLAGVPMICSMKDTSRFATHAYDFERFGTHYTGLGNCIAHLLCGRQLVADRSPFFRFRKVKISGLTEERGEGFIVAVHTGGATYWRRRWPEDKYLELCRLFLKYYPGRLILVGGSEEYDENETLRQTLLNEGNDETRIVNFCGSDINLMANVLAAADVFVGNDSAPMHIATALNTRVIAIFGPSPISNVNPTAHDRRNITVHAGLECVPCGSRTCRLASERQFSCLTDLPVSLVWQKLRGVLETTTRTVATTSLPEAG